MNDMEPQQNLIPQGETDHEGAMAKADLYKLANYSVKLFKKMDDNAQLEAWVQAKITKAADYIASVYHYLEYELEFSNYGSKLENAGIYNEDQKLELKNKLNEAKEIIKALKIAQAQKLEEAKSPKAKKDYDKDGEIESEKDEVLGSRIAAAKKAGNMEESYDDDEDPDVKKADSELKKRGINLPKVKHKEVPIKKTSKDKEEELDESWDDDDEDEDVKRADSELKKHGVKLPKVKHKEVPIKKTSKDKEEELDEGNSKKPDFLDLDKDGNKKEPMKKAAKEKKLDESADLARMKEFLTRLNG